MRFKSLFLTCLCCLCPLFVSAASADWYLYVWSEAVSGDLGQFETTETANVFVIPTCKVSVEGIGFCVRSGDWTTQYGWKMEAVSATGVEVELATATQANGWLNLPVGSYKVTFNVSALTIRFDVIEDQGGSEQQTGTFLRGGDLSMVTYLEDWGTVFRYKDGTAGDVFDILETYGVNFARLRLYHTPGTGAADHDGTYRTPVKSTKYPSGYPYAGKQDILNLAKRAKNHNMKICLSIYLSDFWSGADRQMIPQAWSAVTSTAVLGDSVYNYVKEIMTLMKAQGTEPEYVAIGNESNYGILFNDLNWNKVSFGGHTDNIANCVSLFNRAYDAVKAISPTSQVVIHHSYGHDGRIAICRSFFQNLVNNGGKFDIVGGSYYPHWASQQKSTDNTPTGMLTWAADMKTNIKKPVLIMEVGYSWTQFRPADKNGGNYEGQLHLNGSYNEATEAGQEAFIKELHTALKKDDNIIGYLYWDPIFVDQKVNGKWTEVCWAEKYDDTYKQWWEGGNIISNTTLFDYTGAPLSALYREIASYTPTTRNPSPVTRTPSPVTAQKIFRDNQIYILKDNKIYSLMGLQVK